METQLKYMFFEWLMIVAAVVIISLFNPTLAVATGLLFILLEAMKIRYNLVRISERRVK